MIDRRICCVSITAVISILGIVATNNYLLTVSNYAQSFESFKREFTREIQKSIPRRAEQDKFPASGHVRDEQNEIQESTPRPFERDKTEASNHGRHESLAQASSHERDTENEIQGSTPRPVEDKPEVSGNEPNESSALASWYVGNEPPGSTPRPVEQNKPRCSNGIDTFNKSIYWKFNDDIIPGLHDAFAKDGVLLMIFLVRDWRANKDFTMKNKDWVCDFPECKSKSNGTFVTDGGGEGSTQIVQCDLPTACSVRWRKFDPHSLQARRVNVAARDMLNTSFQ